MNGGALAAGSQVGTESRVYRNRPTTCEEARQDWVLCKLIGIQRFGVC